MILISNTDYKMGNGDIYDQRLSAVFTQLRFPLIFFIILLHCYSTVRLEGDHGTYFKILYPFSLWVGETGVPCFFFISGYLFFLSHKGYFQKIKNRIHTLLIPYILWNSFLIIMYLVAYAAGYPQDIYGRSIASYSILDYIRLYWDRGEFDNGNFVPILCPLWYIRNLLIMCAFSPVIYYCIKYIREFFILALTIWWIYTYNNAFIPQTLLFFSLGAYFPIHNCNPLKVAYKHKVIFLTLFLLLSISDIISHTIISTPVNLQLHRLSLIFNIPALLILADKSSKKNPSIKKVSNSAFIVFCVHYPITIAIRKFCIFIFPGISDIGHILLYFACVAITTLFSLGIYYFLDSYLPKTKKLLSGNR